MNASAVQIKMLVLKFTYDEAKPILKKKNARLLSTKEVRMNIDKIITLLEPHMQGSLKIARVLALNNNKEPTEMVIWNDNGIIRIKEYKHNLNKCSIIYIKGENNG